MSKKKIDTHRERALFMIGDDAPFNFTEAYKALRTNIDYLGSTKGYHSILVTSAGPYDGKSNVTINLATAMGRSGKKVCLMDCDLRKGTIADYLGINRLHPGVTEVLEGKASLKEAIVVKREMGICVLGSGITSNNPSEMIGSQTMLNLIKALSERFDYVFIDTPPVSVVTDAAVLSRFTDGAILVARADVTLKQNLALSKKNLEDVNANILGVILNDYNSKHHASSNGYYGYSYSYSYSEKEHR